MKDAAPKAAEKIQEATEKQGMAEKNLDAEKLDPASKEGKKAAEDLKDASKELAKALTEKKAQEANDQAKLQPQVSPMNAADQVAKAIEQTEKAQQDAKNAQQQLGEKNPAADLQKLQGEGRGQGRGPEEGRRPEGRRMPPTPSRWATSRPPSTPSRRPWTP